MARTGAWAVLGALSFTLLACGGEDHAATPGGSGTGGIGGGAAGGAGLGGAVAGASGAAAAGQGGGGPLATRSCAGQFGPAKPVFVEEPMIAISGISVTADQLELFYTRGQRGTAEQVLVVRKRASTGEPFGALEVLPELAGACPATERVNSDISEDGLTLYITCTRDVGSGEDAGESMLIAARRETRNAAFVLVGSLGGVQAASGISADELVAYGDGRFFNQDPPAMFIRTDKTRSFVQRAPVPGVDTPLGSLDIASDDLVLFGGASRAGNVADRGIFRATRPSRDADFGALEEMQLGLTGTLGAPNITPSCSLYLIMALLDPGGGAPTYSVQLSQQE